jgi:hypothetical protein
MAFAYGGCISFFTAVGCAMLHPAIDFQVNPSDQTIRLRPLAVHYLITGENSNGSVAVLEVGVPGGQRLMAPAHSHHHYAETI